MDRMTKEQRHKCMSHIKGKNTKPEILLRKKLWHLGVRYRKNYHGLYGCPDIVITKYRIAIFVDGDFWHGKDMDKIEARLDTRKSYWIKKLKRNKERDLEVNEILTESGWLVLRFWESEIRKNLPGCVNIILKYLPRK